MVHIYILVDPRVPDPIQAIRYVGKTSQRLEQRLAVHLCMARKGCQYYSSRWIRQLLAENLQPRMVLLETTTDGVARERHWISYYREAGCRLTNLTDGGEGTSGLKGRKLSEEHKEKIRQAVLGRKHSEQAKSRMRRPKSEDTRAKMRKAQQGRPPREFSNQHRSNLSAALKGKPKSPEHAAKVGAAHKGRKKPPMPNDTRQKISSALQGRKPANFSTLHSPENRQKAAMKNMIRPPRAKLTPEDVKRMRQLHETGTYSRAVLAEQFQINPVTVWNIVTYRTWKHI